MNSLLAAQVVLNLQRTVISDVQVGREEGVNTAHLVLVALRDANNHVVNERLDRADGSNLLAVPIDNRDLDLSVVDLGEGDVNVSEVVVQSAAGTGDGHLACLNLDSDVFGDIKDLLLLNETHAVGADAGACSGWDFDISGRWELSGRGKIFHITSIRSPTSPCRNRRTRAYALHIG